MSDDRFTAALRSLQPSVSPAATEDALDAVHAASRRRRHRRQALVAVSGAAAAVLLVAGAVAVLGEDDQGQTVVVDQPTTTSSAPATTTSTSTTTSPPSPPAVVGTLDDLAAGVTGLELRTWWMDGSEPEHWDGFWRADLELAADVTAALLDAGPAVAQPPTWDLVTMRFELADGRVVFVEVDLESGWVAPDRSIGADLARELRTGFNDAVGRPWEETDVSNPASPVAAALARISFPLADLDDAARQFQEAFEAGRDADYERWFVEVFVEGHGPVVEVRHRGMGDDSSHGTDHRFTLVEVPGGWEVGGVASRHLCLRSTPGPAPEYACL